VPPRVTQLVELPRERVRVELDGRPWRTLPAAAVVSAGLVVGTELDRERARELARARRRTEALATAARALAHRDRSNAGLAAQLERRGVRRSDATEALASLAAAGYVDDARFAANRARSLAERGYGDDAIRDALAREGVAPDEAAAAVEALWPETERAAGVLLRARTAPAGIRRLAARGFSSDTIESALAEARLDFDSRSS